MTSLIISQKSTSNKNITTTITYVNPSNEITNSQLRALAVALVNLTTNRFQSVSKQVVDEILP